MSLVNPILRVGLTAAHKLLKAGWFVRRPRTYGAHAIALTPHRRIILVKLRYAPGWRVPGGGRKASEYAQAAAIRELREEIGMTAFGRIRFACELEESVDFKRDLAALLIVEDVRYRPHRWSWEVEEVGEFELDDLPRDTAAPTVRWIDALSDRI
ncbi:MAG TPA: NUDIX domain-containing protein [Sphingomicrobium sp.]|jgi:8-oxo-dGTP pyrophosphatase MutT (NUDIX family)